MLVAPKSIVFESVFGLLKIGNDGLHLKDWGFQNRLPGEHDYWGVRMAIEAANHAETKRFKNLIIKF